jgi:hypothetical protein
MSAVAPFYTMPLLTTTSTAAAAGAGSTDLEPDSERSFTMAVCPLRDANMSGAVGLPV